MAYIKIMFQDSPSTATPLNAENLNHMDNQIALNDQRLTEIETSYVKSFNGRKGEVVPEDGDYDIGQISPLNGATVGQVPVIQNVGTAQEPVYKFGMQFVSGGGIFYGTCTGEEANQIKAVTVSNEQNFELKAGLILAVKFDANNTYSATTENPVKLNVNNTGAKQIYGGNTATPTGTNTTYFGRLNYYNYYVYDGTYWVWAGSSADNNTTYTPQGLGFGYAICSTAAATTAKVATLSGYSLVTNGIVSVKFTNSVPANATLNINNKGAKNIYYQGAKIVAGVIKAGDIATFVYSGNYNLICIDRGSNGHIIVDSSGSQLASENSLQFPDSHVSDDPTNGRTVVENIKEHTTKADYDQATEDGIHVIDDGNDALIGAVSDDYVEVVADGDKTIGTLLNELALQVDFTKLLDNVYIQEDINGVKNVYLCRQHRNNSATFFNGGSASSGARVTTYYVKVNSSTAEVSTGTSYSDVTASQKPSLNTVIRLYYGTQSAPIELTTDAEHCMLPDGETSVASALTITKTQFTPKVGASSSLATRNFYVTDNRTFLEVHFCLSSTTAIADQSEIMDLPTIAQNKISQYDIAAENKSRNTFIVSNSNTALVLTGATTAQNGNYLFGTFRMSLLA